MPRVSVPRSTLYLGTGIRCRLIIRNRSVPIAAAGGPFRRSRFLGELGAKRILTMHKPKNAMVSALYEKLEFERTGAVLDDGDILRERKLHERQ